MKKKIIIIGIISLLIFCGCEKNEGNKIIVGEWLQSFADDYLEFFDDGTFERSCTNYLCLGMVKESTDRDEKHERCLIKGTYVIKNKTSIHLHIESSNCELKEDINIYGFTSDFSRICANNAGLCAGGWEKIQDTPNHLDGKNLN